MPAAFAWCNTCRLAAAAATRDVGCRCTSLQWRRRLGDCHRLPSAGSTGLGVNKDRVNQNLVLVFDFVGGRIFRSFSRFFRFLIFDFLIFDCVSALDDTRAADAAVALAIWIEGCDLRSTV